jgi:septal ring factor EnvC (AmiA/AmiB activator)
MNIELLWIIPIISFTVFIFLVIYFAQRKALQSDLKKEVTNFNNGVVYSSTIRNQPENRLQELEKSITVVTSSIESQQKVIDRFKHENAECTTEINDLKNKLRELYKEYDIVLSENYSLRAKMKKMIEGKAGEESSVPELPVIPLANNDMRTTDRETRQKKDKINLKLYEDTRLLNIANLEDFENKISKSGS